MCLIIACATGARGRRCTESNTSLMLLHSKNEMVVMTIPYGYFSCMYSLLFVDSSVKLTFSYGVYASFICDSIVIFIDVHPTNIPLTHGFQGNSGCQ